MVDTLLAERWRYAARRDLISAYLDYLNAYVDLVNVFSGVIYLQYGMKGQDSLLQWYSSSNYLDFTQSNKIFYSG